MSTSMNRKTLLLTFLTGLLLKLPGRSDAKTPEANLLPTEDHDHPSSDLALGKRRMSQMYVGPRITASDAEGHANTGLTPSTKGAFRHGARVEATDDTTAGELWLIPSVLGDVVIKHDSFLLQDPKTPRSHSDSGRTGMMCWDEDYLYICVGPSQWKRTSLKEW